MQTTISQAIRDRRSVRKFKPDVQIPQAHIDLMLEAAMMAPSAGNTRPWEFIVVENQELKERIVEASPPSRSILGASLAIIVCGLPEAQSMPIMRDFWPQDCGAATENLMLQALDLGYGSCWCGAYPRSERVEGLQKLLGITSIPVAIVAVGVPDEEPEAKGYYDASRVKWFK